MRLRREPKELHLRRTSVKEATNALPWKKCIFTDLWYAPAKSFHLCEVERQIFGITSIQKCSRDLKRTTMWQLDTVARKSSIKADMFRLTGFFLDNNFEDFFLTCVVETNTQNHVLILHQLYKNHFRTSNILKRTMVLLRAAWSNIIARLDPRVMVKSRKSNSKVER